MPGDAHLYHVAGLGVDMVRVDRWLVAGLVTLVGACGDTPGIETASEGGTGTDSAAPSSTSTGGDVPTGSGSDSETPTGGSNSDSATMATTGVDPTTGGPTDPTTGGPTSDTTGDTTGATTGDATTDTSTGSTGPVDTTGGTDTTAGDTDQPIVPCADGKLWTLDAEFDEGVLANLNHDDPNNDQLQITVDGFSAPKPYMFVAQTNDGWILKLDTVTGKQLARYPSVRLADCPSCNAQPNTWYPSRIIVDFDGDMYVANRAFGFQGSLTKIAGGASACVDRNNNGQIETSSDVNADGVVDVANPAEYLGQADECILYSTAVGAADTWPRALTLDGKGNAWVGTYQDKKAIKLDITVTPPAVLKTIQLPSTPYGFSIRGDYLYSSALGQPVMRIDLTDDSVVTMNAPNNYGIAIDDDGIGWFAGFPLSRCDFDVGGDCTAIANISGNGVAVDSVGQVWVAGGNLLYKYTNAGVLLGTANTPGSYGVAIGHDGDPRVISNSSAFKVVNGGEGTPPGAVSQYNTGLPNNPNVNNYTYSDFTGFAAQNVTVKKGEWTVAYDSGMKETVYTALTVNAEPQGKIPAGTSITFQIRAAATAAELPGTPWVDVVDDVPVVQTLGRHVELRARLLISGDEVTESPVLSDVCVHLAGG
jgi:hypothetical protein